MTDESNRSDRPVVDRREVASLVQSVARSETSLHEHLEAVGPVDPSRPSRLPGWTIGHVLTHLARNADSHVAMLAGLPQYPAGSEGRNADIEAGATRPWDESCADLVRSGRALVDAFVRHDDWDATAHTLGGLRPVSMLPLLRQREIELHRIDLGLGAEFAALPSDYVRRDLRALGMIYASRQPMGMTELPAAALALSPTDRLAWLAGRSEPDGLAPAGVF